MKGDPIQELANQILEAKRHYYAGNPIISDQDYDRLEDQLRELSPNHPVLQIVGSDASSSGTKLAHRTPMLSLAKTYKLEELESWMGDQAVVGTPKLDGNSLSLVYRDGELVQAKTRGNGREGEDVLTKAVWVKNIPKTVEEKAEFEVRGELCCSQSQFAVLTKEMINRSLEKPTSPRNIVAGVLGRKKDFDLAHHFQFIAFDTIFHDGPIPFQTEIEKMKWLKKKGFEEAPHTLIKKVSALPGFLEEIQQSMDTGNISLDGAVFTFNELSHHEALGATAHHPRFKMSFKWQGATAVSKIEKIQWATSRLGIVTPVAVIEPVELSGAKITNITLHNASMVENYNLKPGDEIELVRSGEVIPKFLRVVSESKGKHKYPNKCPACQSTLEFDDVRLTCPNVENCPAQQIGQILNWIKSVEIDDLSEKRVEAMLSLGLISDIPGLYRLTKEQILSLPLTKEKMAQKLFTNITNSKRISLPLFLKGLGISGAGATTWEKLIEHFPSLAKLQKATAEQMVAIDGFAEKSAQSIASGLLSRKALIDELLSVGIEIEKTQVVVSGDQAFTGLQFVITGSLSQPRNVIAARIKSAGGKVSSAVSKNTHAVITNDTDSTSSKMKKAQSLGIPIWSEDKLESEMSK